MMRVICQFKILAIIVLTFFVLSSKGQIYQVMPQYGYKYNRISTDSTLHIPSFCGVPNITDYIKNGMIAIDTCNNVLFQWTRANGWTPISTGTYLDTTSLSNRINQRVKYTDTLAMLNPYLKKVDTIAMLSRYLRKSDTASLSNRINLKLNISDTSSMLNPYLRKVDTTAMLSKYLRIFDTTAMLTGKALKSTTITTTAPLTGGGNLTTNRTISIPKATGTVDGYIGATDFDRFAYALGRVSAEEPLYRIRYANPTIGFDSVKILARQVNPIQDGYLTYPYYNYFHRKVDTLYKVGDTLVCLKNNPYKSIFNRDTFKIAIGGGGSTIDTTNKFVNNVIKLNDSTISVYKGTGFTNITLSPSTTVANATRLVTTVYNNSGATITKGSVVYINGRHSSNYPTIAKAQANTEANSYSTFAMVQDDITNGSTGIVIQAGNISNLNLPIASYSDGQIVYLSPTVAGGITTTKPLAPNHIVKIGTITRAHSTLGSIELKIENGWQLDELSDVKIAAVPLDSTILQFSRVDSLWHDVNPTTAMGNRFLKVSDSAAMLSKYLRKTDTTNKFVNSILRIPGKDSIIFYIGSTRYAIKDSSGGGGGTPGGYNSLVQFNNNGSFDGDPMFNWDNTNKRLGIGIDEPQTTLDVRQGTGNFIPSIYEVAMFSKDGDTKIGIYNSGDYGTGGASIMLGHTKNTNASQYYPGFEFQNGNDSASSSGFVRYNYVEKDVTGAIGLASTDLFNINSNGLVQINPTNYGLSASPRLVVGDDNYGAMLETSGDAFINSTLRTAGARQKRITYINDNDIGDTYSVATDDHIIIYATNNNECTIYLPAYPENGRELVIKHAGNYFDYNLYLNANGQYFYDIDAGTVRIALDTQPNTVTIVYYDGMWYLLTGQIDN